MMLRSLLLPLGLGWGLGTGAWLGLAAGLLTTLNVARAEEKKVLALETISPEIKEVYQRCQNTVVKIRARDEHGTLGGTGFLVDSDGTLFTTYSVGGETTDIVVTVADAKYPARRVLADRKSGVAILKIDASTSHLKLGKSSSMEIASPVILVGFPLDLPLAPSLGLVAGFDMGNDARWFAMRHIRATVPVQRGESGAPLLNLQGEVIGMLVSTTDDNNSGILALPGEAVEKIYRDYVRYGTLKPGFLAVDVRPTDAVQNSSSARIRTLAHDGAGHKGGLRAGDVITRIGSRIIHSPEDVIDAGFYLTADEPETIVVTRAGQTMEFQVCPGDPPGNFPRETTALGAVLGR